MFFINTKDLDPVVSRDVQATNYIESPNPIDPEWRTERVLAFAKWITEIALPIIQSANPDLRPGQKESSTECSWSADNRDIHRDTVPRDTVGRDVVFLTLGMTSTGQTSGTVLARSRKYESSNVHQLPENIYQSEIIETPAGYATVFRPHVDPHASPRDISNRTLLYKATFNFDGSKELVTPDSELCLDV